MKLAVIFPGWGTPKRLYDLIEIEGYQKIYADFRWTSYIEKIASQEECEEVIFIAWSMGTITAIEMIDKIEVKKAVLISPTLKFTESQHEIVVKKMMKNVERDSKKTIDEFSKLNFNDENKYKEYIDIYGNEIDYDSAILSEGLNYLLTKDISSINIKNDITPIIFTGKYDKIITTESSKKVEKIFGKTIAHEFECGHNVIFEKREELNSFIRSYIYDREEQGEEKLL